MRNRKRHPKVPLVWINVLPVETLTPSGVVGTR
jgi:hypothetical protein